MNAKALENIVWQKNFAHVLHVSIFFVHRINARVVTELSVSGCEMIDIRAVRNGMFSNGCGCGYVI